MFAFLKMIFSPEQEDIGVRTKVNRLHTLNGPERIDGLVINTKHGVAYVVWPNGETTLESVRHLVPIVD